jgi:hypothetical protein
MSLTLAGKIALFVNLALSVLFAFLGFGIYSQRINWTDKKIGERDGKYQLKDLRIRDLKAARDRVEARWATALKSPEVPGRSPGGILAMEASRPRKQAWYKQQIEILKTGDANQKILDIDFDQGLIRLNPPVTGLPEMKEVTDQSKKPIPGLASLLILNEAYSRIQKDIVTKTGEIEKLIQEERLLTEQLGDGKVRGLHFDLAQQQLAEKRSLDEQEYLQPLLYNSMVKRQSLEDRRRVLEGRVKKLQASSVAKQP